MNTFTVRGEDGKGLKSRLSKSDVTYAVRLDLCHKKNNDDGIEQLYCNCSDSSRPHVPKNSGYYNFKMNFWKRYGRFMATDTANLTFLMGYLTNNNVTKLLHVWLVLTSFLTNTVAGSELAAGDSKSMQSNKFPGLVVPDQRFYKRMRYSDWTRRFLLPIRNDHYSHSLNEHIFAKQHQEIAAKFPHLQQYHKVLSDPTKSSFGADGSTEITGMWAVKLKLFPENNSRDRLDQAAERIAMQHGLENHGQIGELKGYYLFTKKDVSKTWTTMASAVVQEGGRKNDGVTAPTRNDPQTDSYQTQGTTLYSATETWTTAVSLTPTKSTAKITVVPTISLQGGELGPGPTSQFFEPTPSWNVEQGLSKHNQVEWQGHQVLLTRSKRGLIPAKVVSDNVPELHNDVTASTQDQKTRISTLVTTIREDYLNLTKNNNVGALKLFKTTAPSWKHARPTPSSRPFVSAEERARHEFYVKYMSQNSHHVTITPQQVEVTHNQHYKDMVGGSASGGGIGGRRMGIGDDEEESAGDWWSLNLANTMRSEENNGKKEFFSKFQDPLYGRQWHLKNHVSNTDTGDCNVTGVWDHGITGKGVVVAVVDDGVQWDHPDLIQNYCPEGSFDLNANDDDPMPVRDSKEENKHGTRCAGEIAAAPNNHCGVGVAYGARFSGIRILDGPLTDSMEAAAFNKHLDINDIYSCSWGPEDDGKTVDGPHPLAQAALKHGVVAGRRGFGSIYIVASGNGGHKGDNCNYDGYANSIYTITIGAVDEFGRVPSYAEECASMLACTFSSGAGTEDGNVRKIVTTDWTLGKNKKRTGGCTESHTGTSAATPLAAGMVALMLEARPCLTWRDVQHIIVMTAIKIKPESEEWITNTVGFHHSDKRGFGLLNAWRMVNAARVWRPVPWLTSLSFECPDRRRIIPNVKKRALIVKTLVSEEQCQNNLVFSLEQVLVTVDIEHPRRGDLFITLVCPSGTTSVIGGPRKNDDSSNGLWNWTFDTVKCWGEQPYGTYRLIIHDTKDRPKLMAGELRRWKLTLYGSTLTKEDIMQQRERVEKAMNGEHLSPYDPQADRPQGNMSSNESAPEFAKLLTNQIGYCPPFEQNPFDNLSLLEKPPTERTLKLIGLSGIFFLLWAIYCAVDMGGLTRRGTQPEAQRRTATGANNPVKNTDLPLKNNIRPDDMNLPDSVHRYSDNFTNNYSSTWWNNFNTWITSKLKPKDGDIDAHDPSINFSKETNCLLSTQETT